MNASKFRELPELCSTENKKDYTETGERTFGSSGSSMDF
jgi:hypothetical protein